MLKLPTLAKPSDSLQQPPETQLHWCLGAMLGYQPGTIGDLSL
jgi:hypothetical protein